jgi:hypothetical protein
MSFRAPIVQPSFANHFVTHRKEILVQRKTSKPWKAFGAAGALAALLAWSGAGWAQTGQASAARAVVLGSVTSLADTGTLGGAGDARGTGLDTGSIPGLVSAEALHAATMGWTDQVASQASLGNVTLTVAGTGITADFIQSSALAIAGSGASGAASIEGLSIGGRPVSVTGAPNQLISLPGLSVIVNEQVQSASGIVVNALRIRTLDGLTDIVVGSSRAGL